MGAGCTAHGGPHRPFFICLLDQVGLGSQFIQNIRKSSHLFLPFNPFKSRLRTLAPDISQINPQESQRFELARSEENLVAFFGPQPAQSGAHLSRTDHADFHR
jgi:hypothetical protein